MAPTAAKAYDARQKPWSLTEVTIPCESQSITGPRISSIELITLGLSLLLKLFIRKRLLNY
jgi:hypothetical protein